MEWSRNIPYGSKIYHAASRVFSEAIKTPGGQLPTYDEFKNLLRRHFPSAFEPALALAYSDQADHYDDLLEHMRSGLPLPTPRRIPGRYNERNVPLPVPRPVPPPNNPIYGDAVHGGAAMFFETAAERGGVPDYNEFMLHLSTLLDATPEQKAYLPLAYQDFMNYWRPILLAVNNGDTRLYDGYFQFRRGTVYWQPNWTVGDSGYGNNAYLDNGYGNYAYLEVPERVPVFDTQSVEAEFGRSRRFRIIPRDDSSDYESDYTTDGDFYPDHHRHPWWYDGPGREPYTFDDLDSSSWSRSYSTWTPL
jgi:hypothetical protein